MTELNGLVVALVGLFGSSSLIAQPVSQEAYLKPAYIDIDSETEWFGSAIAVSGNTAVVGAFREDSAATGVNGDQTDDNAFFSGAAYVFVRGKNGWAQQAYLKASNTDVNDNFGSSVAIDGDTIVVGAISEASAATGVNGNQADNSAFSSGAAYIFVRNGSNWSQQAYLKASNTNTDDDFGHTVSISGDTIVVGAPAEASNATGVNGNEASNSLPLAGAAYVFVRDGTRWSQQAYLKATNTNGLDRFGEAVAVSGDTIAVGAGDEDSSATGINGGQGGGAPNSGAAYVFRRTGTSWLQQAYVKASNTGSNDGFGNALALRGDTLAVAAIFESSATTGVDGNQEDDTLLASGAVYVYERSGPTWSQTAYVKASNPRLFSAFGASLALSDDFLVVGSGGESSDADGIDGDQNDTSILGAGAVYVFGRDGASWAQQSYVKASNSDYGDNFHVVGLSAATLLVGARHEDSASPGINGGQDNNLVPDDIGAVYAFDLSGLAPNAWSGQGGALFGAAGDPLLVGSGSLFPGSLNAVELSNAAPSAFTALFIGLASNPTPFKGGNIKPVPWVTLAFTNTTPSGGLSVPFEMPFNLTSGTELWVQVAITDAGAPVGVAISNAVKGVVP